jgi:hypothetical protein
MRQFSGRSTLMRMAARVEPTKPTTTPFSDAGLDWALPTVA